MYKKWYGMAVVLCVVLFMGMTGCAKKNVRHLASDVCLVSPEKTTKEQVLTYLGQPDAQYEMADGSELWVYYDVQKTALRNTPYIGDKLGEKKYETVKVTFRGDIVQTSVYRLLTEEEFEEGELVK
ncbi:MAG: hypothetical protein JSW69_04460 [Deltaproteobacteria bacterium]|nr:MAG: hypothetical protein JSW69_04460 [Deltaproteobacteria bacterium]